MLSNALIQMVVSGSLYLLSSLRGIFFFKGRTSVGHPSDIRRTSVGRPSDVRRTSVGRPSDVRRTFVGQQTSVGRPTDETSEINFRIAIFTETPLSLGARFANLFQRPGRSTQLGRSIDRIEWRSSGDRTAIERRSSGDRAAIAKVFAQVP